MRVQRPFKLLSSSALILALSLNIFFIVGMEWGIMGFLLSSLATSVTTSLILVIATLGNAPIRFSLAPLKKMILFGLPLVPSGLGMFWINFGDRFILKHCYTDWEVGIYSLGYKFAMMLSFLIGQPFFLIWSVRMYQKSNTPAAICSREVLCFFSLVLSTKSAWF